jgi:hypothetical protein
VLDPHLDYRLYKEEMARLEKQLERRWHPPNRERRALPRLRVPSLWQRSVAAGGGC